MNIKKAPFTFKMPCCYGYLFDLDGKCTRIKDGFILSLENKGTPASKDYYRVYIDGMRQNLYLDEILQYGKHLKQSIDTFLKPKHYIYYRPIIKYTK